MWIAQRVLIALYAIVPVIALLRTVYRYKQRAAIAAFGSAVVMGVLLGTTLNLIFAIMAGGSMRVLQVMFSSYHMLAVILMLRLFNDTMEIGLRTLLGVNKRGSSDLGWAVRAGLASLVRVGLLVAVGLPFVMASVMTYRPKIALKDNPQQQLGFPYQVVEFDSADGIHLRGWWIPATNSDKPSNKTVIICHGLGANKSNQLVLASHFVPAGFNALIFDFRAHGQSGGQISTFGDLERYDVLAAVHWVRTTHPDQCKRLFGVGASMGGAALIAAAAEGTDDANAIDAIAVYDTYDSLYRLAGDMTSDHFVWPMDWLLMHIAMPLASMHAGTNLERFVPANLVDHVAPRPILFIHGTEDRIIPFKRGETLYQSASQPKYHLWLKGGDHNGVINDQGVGKIVREFFKSSMSMM